MRIRHILALGLICLSSNSVAQAQDPAPQPAAKPAGLHYEVYAVEGKVRVSATGVDPKLDEGWRTPKVGELLGSGMQISTGFRGRIKLIARPAEPPTVLFVEGGSLLNVRELALAQNIHRARLELAYGAVSAGVAESETRSDMEITSPAATLSKKGTDIFRMEYSNGRFLISLSEQGRGLVQAIQHNMDARGSVLGSRSRFVTAGQFVTERMARAIDNMQWDRKVEVNGMFGARGAELTNFLNDHGFSFLLPQGTNTFNHLDTPSPDGQLAGKPQWDQPGESVANSLFFPPVRTSQPQRDGDFGIGGGLLPGISGNNTSKSIFGKTQKVQRNNRPSPFFLKGPGKGMGPFGKRK